MLELTNVRKTFNKGTINEKKALNGISLSLNDGDFVTVIGGNGAGKSTMLNMIAGVYPIDSGKIEIGGINISRQPEHKHGLSPWPTPLLAKWAERKKSHLRHMSRWRILNGLSHAPIPGSW